MIIASQILFIIVIFFSLCGIFGEREDKTFMNNLTAVCIAGIAALIVSLLLL